MDMDMGMDMEMLLALWHMHLLNEEFLRDLEKRRAEREKMIRRMYRVSPPRYLLNAKIDRQNVFVARLTNGSDLDCFNNLRMHKEAFRTLCYKLENEGGLIDTRYITTATQTAIFLRLLGHHQKIRILGTDFERSGRTISLCFHRVLQAFLRIGEQFFATPNPVSDGCPDTRFKYFKDCLGELDGTYIPCHAPAAASARYRIRKGHIATNVLGVVDTCGKFVYVLCGCEGSAADSRVLHDALHRDGGLKVPQGMYYLCDDGYTNGEGFLTPYRSTRYHLKEWGPGTRCPQNSREVFNMQHSSVRNIVERAFGILKARFAVLRSPTFYPLEIQNKIVMACALLHNYIMSEQPNDPLLMADMLDEEYAETNEHEAEEHINTIGTTPAWTQMRDNLAADMWTQYLNNQSQT